MANEEQLSILKQGVDVWNKWRQENPVSIIDLTGANLSQANLSESDLFLADLSGSDLSESDLCDANLHGANLAKSNLRGARLIRTGLWEANLREADLSNADLTYAMLCDADLSKANLTNANLFYALLGEFTVKDPYHDDQDIHGADLTEANLTKADLTGADLVGTSLVNSNLMQAIVDDADISNSRIYGVNVWDLVGNFREQKNLVITPRGASRITVDNIRVAQFVYLILDNEELRNVINTLTSKSVLILGRFGIKERKAILDVLRSKLRDFDLLPIVFDFDRPIDKDFTETIKTLAGLCYFVIADVTNPKSSPLELQATVPDYQIPFVPIIQEGEKPFAMMVDLQKKYNWVLPTVTYDSMETLIKVLKPLIIDPAMKKRNELRIIKAQVPDVISGKDFLEKGKV